jgi:hypothetical protein
VRPVGLLCTVTLLSQRTMGKIRLTATVPMWGRCGAIFDTIKC